MYNFCKKTRGAVSIFLIIVMLPTLICAGVFLDISRSRLADEVISSSADLALNTVLTAYDKDLKDWYGLFGSCQDVSSAIATAQQYFQDNMVSAYVPTSSPSGIISQIVGPGHVSDMLHLRTDGEISITPVANSAMNNPAMIKRGINEFMKYRAPIHGAEILFEKLSKSEETLKQMECATAEAKMIEARDAFFDAEKKMIQQGEVAYEAIQDYMNTTGTLGQMSSEKYIDQFSTFLLDPREMIKNSNNPSLKDIFKEAHTRLTKNLINTHDTSGTMNVNLIEKQSITDPGEINIFTSSVQAKSNQIEDRLKELNTAIETYMSQKSALDTAWNGVGAKNTGDWGIQYWYQLTKNCKSAHEAYATAASDVWKKYKVAKNAVDNAETDAMTTLMTKPDSSYITYPNTDATKQLSLQSVYDSLDAYYTTNISGAMSINGGCDSFQKINNQIDLVDTDANRARLNHTTVSEIYPMAEKLGYYVQDFKTASDKLKKAADETDKMGKAIEDYKEAFEEWEQLAFVSELDNSQLATAEPDGDRAMILDLEENSGLLKLTKESADQLAARLNNAKAVFEALTASVENIKYNGTSVTTILGYKAFCDASGLDKDSIPVDNTALETYAEEHFKFEIEEQLLRIIIQDGERGNPLKTEHEYFIDYSNSPDLNQGDLPLYDWMKNKFGGPTNGIPCDKDQAGYDVNDKGSAKEADKEIGKKKKDTGEADESENITGNSFGQWSGAELPSKLASQSQEKHLSADVGNAANTTSELIPKLLDIIRNGMENCRDALFFEDYLFTMFTFDTFDNEGCFSLVDKDQQDKVTPSNKDSYYQLSSWQSSKENMTPTLHARNATNNWCYGGELEYIMYGFKDNSLNKAAAYSEIYAIRYAMDLSPVFQAYWNDRAVKILALALETFAHIPVGATKCVVCLAITAAEAGMDNSYLRAGIPVLFYKPDVKSLFCDYRSIFMGEKKPVAKTDGVKFQYSEYLKLFMLVSMAFNENNLYLRTGDVIQANMTLATKDGQYALSNANTFYTLEATAKINTMWSRLSEVEGIPGLTRAEGWKTTKIKMKRGY